MNEFTSYLRRIWRASLTADALLTLEEVAEALPGRLADPRGWLERHVNPAGVVEGGAVFRWGDVLAVFNGRNPAREDRPVTSWRAAAAVLGISDDTLARRRRARDPDREPYFEDAEEVRAWWRTILAPVEVPKRQKQPKRSAPVVEAPEGPVNWNTVTKDIIAKRKGRG